VIENYASFAQTKSQLSSSALPDGARQSRFGRHDRATNALSMILNQYPDSYLCDRSMLLVGQQLKDPVAARKIYSDALPSASRTRLVAGNQLAIARTFTKRRENG